MPSKRHKSYFIDLPEGFPTLSALIAKTIWEPSDEGAEMGEL